MPDNTELARVQRIYARLFAGHAKRTKGRARVSYLRRAEEATKRAEQFETLGGESA